MYELSKSTILKRGSIRSPFQNAPMTLPEACSRLKIRAFVLSWGWVRPGTQYGQHVCRTAARQLNSRGGVK
jgi:hypothetical protein